METYKARDCFVIGNHFGTPITIFAKYYENHSWSLDNLPRVPERTPKFVDFFTCPTGPHTSLREAISRLLNVSGKSDQELIRFLTETGKCFDLLQAESICKKMSISGIGHAVYLFRELKAKYLS